MRANVYIDGFNLYYGALKPLPNCKWLDLDALCRRLLPRDEIHRIRYFTALVSARPHDPQQPVRQQVYIRALETIPHLTVHYGTYKTRTASMPLARPRPGHKTARVRKTEEKGSDVNLATYLLLDAFKRDCEVAVVISNDADLKEPIALTQTELGIPVGVINPHPPHKRSRDIKPAFFKQIRESALRTCQFPTVMRDAKGDIHRPANWS
ncbi:MAG TPA: NYN domain-containing protein [Thermoleophilaceae bacterium]